MTAGIAGTGAAHVVTALALRRATTAGRVWHAVGGAADSTAVALFPLPGGQGEADAPLHALTAAVAFGLLGTWPVVERLARGRRADRGSRPACSDTVVVAGSAVLLGTLAWFGAELGGDRVGLAERAAAGAQSLWPLVVVLSARTGARGR